MSRLEIAQIPARTDNYIYLLHCPETGATAAVDPTEAPLVQAALNERGWTLTHILNTHHHDDHVGGNAALKAATDCTIIGAANDAARIPGIDIRVGEADTIAIGTASAKIFEVPGHTSGHIAYWFPESDALFCGDTLFALGCGRLFEGTAAQMWESLLKLRALPDMTRVYCAHEYTNANADFALTVEPDNALLKIRAAQVTALRQAGKPTVPSTIGEEKATNPFFRADEAALLSAAGLVGQDPVTAFAEIRHRKDVF